jgi:hypothetical protein
VLPGLDRVWGSDALVLACLSITGYATVFSFEAGFCSFYDIPLQLVSLNLSTGLAAAGVLSTLAFLFVTNADVVIRLLRIDGPDGILKAARLLAIVAVTGLTSIVWNVNIVVPVVVLLVSIPTALAIRKRRGMQSQHGFGPLALLETSLDQKCFFVIALVSALLVYAFFAGRVEATREPRYVGKYGGINYILLRVYGDSVIAAPYFIKTVDFKPLLAGKETERVLVVKTGLRFFKIGAKEAPPDFAEIAPSLIIERDSHSLKTGFWRWIAPYRD